MAEFGRFDRSLLKFLKDLEKNNERDWFQANKQRYEDEVREPARAFIRAFIRAFSDELDKFSLHFIASDKKVGGSLMRVYRDTRFSKDKTPYKTNVGIHFRHELCGDVHAPGFYVHIAPRECFLGVGIWHPAADSLASIRKAIDRQSDDWIAARDDKKFEAMRECLSRLRAAHLDLAARDQRHAESAYAAANEVLLGVIIGSVLLGVFLIWNINRGILETMRAVIRRDGEVSEQVASSATQVLLSSQHFTSAAEDVHEVFRKIRDSASVSFEELDSSICEIRASSGKIAGIARETHDNADRARESVHASVNLKRQADELRTAVNDLTSFVGSTKLADPD